MLSFVSIAFVTCKSLWCITFPFPFPSISNRSLWVPPYLIKIRLQIQNTKEIQLLLCLPWGVSQSVHCGRFWNNLWLKISMKLQHLCGWYLPLFCLFPEVRTRPAWSWPDLCWHSYWRTEHPDTAASRPSSASDLTWHTTIRKGFNV